ncbi:MAG: polyamine aminopropyltransferase [Alphaproteobacteria bacterium]
MTAAEARVPARTAPAPWPLWLQDGVVLGVMVVLAAACIVYEYLLSHYAGRVLGMMEHAIFAMIGVMIVSMGLGSLAARRIRDPDTGFLVVELSLAVLGASGILLIAGAVAFAQDLPVIIAQNFSLPRDAVPTGALTAAVDRAAGTVPYLVGAAIGVLIGMEIPLIARVREALYRRHLTHNTGTVYGFDYVGAGLGAAIFITVLLALPPEQVAVGVAAVNLTAGTAFLALRWRQVSARRTLAAAHALVLLALLLIGTRSGTWHALLEDSLYQDHVILAEDTDFQHITVTGRTTGTGMEHRLYLNGRLQFCSCDEVIYHSMLVAPPLLAAARTDDILLIGGGDGLALRNMLHWEPRRVTVLELDRRMVSLFSERQAGGANAPLIALNESSFDDPRVNVRFGDAFNTAQALLAEGRRFDAIVVDLPDPSHPDLNKLYSVRFYALLRRLLTGDGALAVQSTSPFHARDAFLTVGVTLEAAGFGRVAPYRANVPSFGEWGWTLAAPDGAPLSTRIAQSRQSIPAQSWATPDLIEAAFAFPKNFLARADDLTPNTVSGNAMYRLHQDAWAREDITVTGQP